MKQLLYLQSGDRGAGIFSYVMQVIVMAKVCKDRNIPMYVDLSENMLYFKDCNKPENVWNYYFEQPFKDLNLDEYDKEYAVWYQDDRPLQLPFRYTIDSEFLKQARQYCKEFVKLKPELLEKANNFLTNNIGKNYLAIHKRGTDHENASYFTLENYFQETDKYIDNYKQLLVCSDEQYSIDAFKKRYGNKVISYDSVRETDPNAVHDCPHGQRKGAHNKYFYGSFVYQNGRDCVIEAYLLSQSSFLLKTLSNVSHFAVMSNDNLDFVWIDENYKTFY